MKLSEELTIVFVAALAAIFVRRVIHDELLAVLLVFLFWTPGRLLFEFVVGGVVALLARAVR